ncbi:MAG: ABC transporter substrate-binding protein [Pseudomonadota bacterium]
MKSIRAFLLALSLAVPSFAFADDGPRIVVAGGDLTEIVFALGRGDDVVGVDTTSGWPLEATTREQVGYMRRLSAEGVLSLTPDLLLVAPDAGPKSVLELIEKAGVEIATAPGDDGADGVADKIAFVSTALGATEAGEAAKKDYQLRLDGAREIASGDATGQRVLFVLSIRDGAPIVGGADTSANEMIREAGAVNAAADIDGYKPMNAEAIIAAAPDVILMTNAHADRLGGLDDVLDRPDISLTPAGRERRAVLMDALLLLGMGPRTPEAIVELSRGLSAKRDNDASEDG